MHNLQAAMQAPVSRTFLAIGSSWILERGGANLTLLGLLGSAVWLTGQPVDRIAQRYNPAALVRLIRNLSRRR